VPPTRWHHFPHISITEYVSRQAALLFAFAPKQRQKIILAPIPGALEHGAVSHPAILVPEQVDWNQLPLG